MHHQKLKQNKARFGLPINTFSTKKLKKLCLRKKKEISNTIALLISFSKCQAPYFAGVITIFRYSTGP